MSAPRTRTEARRLAALLVLAAALWSTSAAALPLYAQRSGRTCGNCHASPTYEDEKGWDNPRLLDRKCNMSCMTCHVNPTGGGLRTASGRYYGQSTLSMLPLQERSYSDHGRELLPERWIRRFRDLFRPRDYVHPGGEERTIPSNLEEVHAGIGQGAGQHPAWLTFGGPDTPQGKYALWDGRYGDLSPDPTLNLGVDARTAYWSANNAVFPMQADVHAAVHPSEHLTLMATAAARGRSGGYEAFVKQDRTPVFARNAFLMVHELPGMSYARAGIFMPSFGTYIDDHTSFIREYFEMDVSTSDDTVMGFEMGTAPNYPFATVSVFGNQLPEYAPSGTSRGYGSAVNLGWRDLGFSLTAHGMIKRRPLDARGDLDAGGVAWGLNPAYYWGKLPITYMGELSVGRIQRPVLGSEQKMVAMYHEVWVVLFNGVSLRGKYDWGRRDAGIEDGGEQRWSVGLDLSPAPGFTLLVQGRWLRPEAAAESSSDVFTHLHVWF